MKLHQRGPLLIAVALAAVAGATLATRMHRQTRRTERELQHRSSVKDWENEGGNLAPAPATAIPLAARP